MPDYDALVLVSFGGPEGPDDVMPFLENVVRGKNVPRERLLEVAGHYKAFDGHSPINPQTRALVAAIVAELNAHGPRLPVYWGNRHWHPMLSDTVRQMADDGVERALAFCTSAFGSASGCREYREAIESARREVGPDAPRIEKLRLFYNHPGFIEAVAQRAADAWAEIPTDRRGSARFVFSAHSLPTAAAERCPYERQLRETCRLAAERVVQLHPGDEIRWELAYQSRSGPPGQPWLGPDIGDLICRFKGTENVTDVVISPVGFVTENMEVAYDLDVEAGRLCQSLGVNMVRAAVVGSHPRFVEMVRQLVMERMDPEQPRLALGQDGPWPVECPPGCCGQS